MSKAVALEPPICEFCGEHILNEDQICPACDDGRRCYRWRPRFRPRRGQLLDNIDTVKPHVARLSDALDGVLVETDAGAFGGSPLALEYRDTVDVGQRQVRRVLAEFLDAGYIDHAESGTVSPRRIPDGGKSIFPNAVTPLAWPLHRTIVT